MDLSVLPAQQSYSTPPVAPQKSPSPYIAPLVVFFIGIVLLPLFLIVVLPKNEWFAMRQFVVNYLTGRDYIFVREQSFGDQFFVNRVRMSAPGYLVLITSDVFGSPNEYVVGTSGHLSPGIHTNVPIIFDENAYMDDPKTYIRVPLGPPFWQPGATVFVQMIVQDDSKPMTGQWHWVQDAGGVPIFAKTRVL